MTRHVLLTGGVGFIGSHTYLALISAGYEVTILCYRTLRLSDFRAQIDALADMIGAHSHGHELLDQLPLEAALRSAVRSRALLKAWTGREVRHFAYPNGNYSPGLMSGLAKAGFVSATILEERLVRADTPPLALPRVSVGRYDALDRLRLRMVGI